MELPEFDVDKMPKEVTDKLGHDIEVVPLGNMDEYEPNVDPGRDEYLTRKLLRQLDEMKALEKVHNKKLSKKQTWKEVKKVARYFKSPLYQIKALDRGANVPYNTESEEP